MIEPPDHAGHDRLAGPQLDLDRLAHELRAPLAAIQSMADALASGHLGAVDPRHAGYLVSIRETARHALAVMQGMIAAGGSDALAASPSRQAVDLDAVAHEVTTAMALLAGRYGVRLEWAPTASGAVYAWASATDVRQMLINLVANGIAHTGGGATVRVGAGADAGGVWLTVADNGPGISEAELSHIGQDIPSQKPEGHLRVKLGLRLTRQLAAENAGRLDLASSPSGTLARIVLPPSRDVSPV